MSTVHEYDYATILLNGEPMPVGRVEIGELFTGGDSSEVGLVGSEPVVSEFECSFEGPPPSFLFEVLSDQFAYPEWKLTYPIHGGTLLMFVEQRLSAATADGVQVLGLCKRMLYTRGGDTTAWDPASVSVGFIVDVGGAKP